MDEDIWKELFVKGRIKMGKPMGSTKITPGIFSAAKLLIENGANNTEVSKYLKVSTDVVAMFRKAETYEEYQALMYQYSQEMRKRQAAIKAKEQAKAEPPQTTCKPEEINHVVTVQLSHYVMSELQKQNELLTVISNKLAFIVDELCGVKTNAKQDN